MKKKIALLLTIALLLELSPCNLNVFADAQIDSQISGQEQSTETTTEEITQPQTTETTTEEVTQPQTTETTTEEVIQPQYVIRNFNGINESFISPSKTYTFFAGVENDVAVPTIDVKVVSEDESIIKITSVLFDASTGNGTFTYDKLKNGTTNIDFYINNVLTKQFPVNLYDSISLDLGDEKEAFDEYDHFYDFTRSAQESYEEKFGGLADAFVVKKGYSAQLKCYSSIAESEVSELVSDINHYVINSTNPNVLTIDSVSTDKGTFYKYNAVGYGSCYITIEYNGKVMSQYRFVVVDPKSKKKVKLKISDSKMTGILGEEEYLLYSVPKKDKDYDVVYKSSNNKVVKVNQEGLLKFKKKGKATISVTCEGTTKKCKITVKNTKYALKYSSITIDYKKTKDPKFTSTVKFPLGNKNIFPKSGKSSNSTIAEYDEDANTITGLKAGRCKITFTMNNGQKLKMDVKVNESKIVSFAKKASQTVKKAASNTVNKIKNAASSVANKLKKWFS